MKRKMLDIDDPYFDEICRNNRFVSDGIGDDFENWDCFSPVFICAQTGHGKNYFVEEKVIPTAVQKGQRVLLFCNRVALGLQTKRRIAKLLGMDNLLDELTSEGLRRRENFGPVSVMSYQNFSKKLSNPQTWYSCSEFSVVILDEVHFFMADAQFNSETGHLLDVIPQLFNGAVRIYLSATPDEVLPHIIDAEKYHDLRHRVLRGCTPSFSLPPRLKAYVFPSNHQYIRPHFFTLEADVITAIKEAPCHEKWVIFIESRKQGERLSSIFEGDSVFLDAESRKDPSLADTWTELVEAERFKQRILITTSVIDNGVNIKDPEVCNVVVFPFGKTSLMQSIGRIRVSEGQKISAYFFCPNAKLLVGRMAKLRALQKYMRPYGGKAFLELTKNISREAGIQTEEILNLFTTDPNKKTCFIPNPLASAKIKLDLNFFEETVDLLSAKGHDAVAKRTCEWLGIKYKNGFWLDSDKTAMATLYKFLEDSCNVDIPEKEFDPFAEKYHKLRVQAFGLYKNDRTDRPNWKLTTVRNRLKIDGYMITKVESAFRIKKLNGGN